MQLVALPDVLTNAAAYVALFVTGLIAWLAPQIALIPGFRPNDASRNILLRILVIALNGGLLVAYGATQGAVLTSAMLPTLFVFALGQWGTGHFIYKGAKAAGLVSGPPAPSAPSASVAPANASASDSSLAAALAQAAAAAQAAETALQGSK